MKSLVILCALATLALATPLAKQNRWKAIGKRTKKSPDGIGFGRHHTSHGGSSGGGRSQSASSGYGAAAAPVCRTVNEEQCETVNDQICDVTNRQQCQSVSDTKS